MAADEKLQADSPAMAEMLTPAAVRLWRGVGLEGWSVGWLVGWLVERGSRRRQSGKHAGARAGLDRGQAKSGGAGAPGATLAAPSDRAGLPSASCTRHAAPQAAAAARTWRCTRWCSP